MKTSYLSQHHSFDINMAAVYGIQEALLIHHFQHWIVINIRNKRNFIEGRTWTYQTLDEIASNFPYLSKSQVYDAMERLCLGRSRRSKKQEFEPVLMKGSFNANKYDHTTWYAFVNKEMFLMMANAKIDDNECHDHVQQMPTSIVTDTITDTKAQAQEKPKKPEVTPSSHATLSTPFLQEMSLQQQVPSQPKDPQAEEKFKLLSPLGLDSRALSLGMGVPLDEVKQAVRRVAEYPHPIESVSAFFTKLMQEGCYENIPSEKVADSATISQKTVEDLRNLGVSQETITEFSSEKYEKHLKELIFEINKLVSSGKKLNQTPENLIRMLITKGFN